jgi:hypothetical protein
MLINERYLSVVLTLNAGRSSSHQKETMMPRKYAILRDCSDNVHTYSLFDEQGTYTGSMMHSARRPIDSTRYILDENSRCTKHEPIPLPEEDDGFRQLDEEDRIIQEYNWGTRL